jgi:transcriptional regulator with GAF, ATPase, and Fis domain
MTEAIKNDISYKSELINQAHMRLTRKLRSEDLLFCVKQEICRLMGAERAAVYLGEGDFDTDWVVDEAFPDRRPSYTVIRQARSSAEGYHVQEISRRDATKSQMDADIKSCCAARVAIGDPEYPTIIGAIYCDTRYDERRFTESDAIFLKELAAQFSCYIELSLMKHKTVTLESEHEIGIREKLNNPEVVLARIVGVSNAMKDLRKDLERVAPHDLPILIIGETGTGKNVFAKAIHELSPRLTSGQFVEVVCANVEANLFGSDLFGHEKGAFTGAIQGKQGMVLIADGGTLFLDEIGDLPYDLQGKLLQVLQEKKLRPVGAVKDKVVDFRLIAATNKNLKKMVEAGTFRKDLYSRFSDFPIYIPPLRERREDAIALARHFARTKHSKKRFTLTEEAENFLLTMDFPDNVRGLEKLIEAAMMFYAQGTEITAQDLKKVQEKKRSVEFLGAGPTETPDSGVVPELIARTDQRELHYKELIGMLDNHEITGRQLSEVLTYLYTRFNGTPSSVAEWLHLDTDTEKREFYAKIRYLRKKGVIQIDGLPPLLSNSNNG